jgi:Xaa-Pro dipeptidase
MTRDPAPLSRRRLLQLSGGAGALLAAAASDGEAQAPAVDEAPEAVRALRPMTDGVSPIAPDEHRARLARAQRLLAESGLDAMVVGPGSSLAYFTGAEWGLSERFLGVVLGRTREPVWVVPSFEKDRALEKIRVGTDVRPWAEDESPYRLVAAALADLGARAGRVGIEETMPFAFSDGIGGAAPAARLASATPVTAGCRQVKDAHELALIRRACAVTLAAYRAVFASLTEGLTVAQVAGWVAAAHRGLGFRGGALVLFGPDAAFPHGTAKPKLLARGDVALIDGGCRVHGYESDITRTGVFGAPPTDRQRRIWDLVRKAQAAAFDAARPGVECQAVDAAARKVIDEGGFGPGYEHFTHRLGHGIGLDGHEWQYMVRGNTTKLAAGITFTDEPGIYVPGELGIRHEDTLAVTESGCENLVPKWSGTPEEPVGV